MPMVPEAAIAMLACARLGVIHTVIFGGFSSEAIKDRVNDCQARVIITADGGWRRGQDRRAQGATSTAPCRAPRRVERVIVLKRTGHDVPMVEGRDRWWHDFVAGKPASAQGEGLRQREPALHPLHERLDGQAEGRPAHERGLPAAAPRSRMKYVFDLKDDDVYFCTADVGWVTGHSYVVYGPARGRRHGPHVRGGAQPPGARPVLGS